MTHCPLSVLNAKEVSSHRETMDYMDSTFDALCAVNARVLFHAIVYPVKNKTLRERSLQVNIEPFIELVFFLSQASLFRRVLRKMSA